jgi:hypothetical protein
MELISFVTASQFKMDAYSRLLVPTLSVLKAIATVFKDIAMLLFGIQTYTLIIMKDMKHYSIVTG